MEIYKTFVYINYSKSPFTMYNCYQWFEFDSVFSFILFGSFATVFLKEILPTHFLIQSVFLFSRQKPEVSRVISKSNPLIVQI